MCQELITRIPVDRFLGYIELTLNWFNVKFSTSVSDLKPSFSKTLFIIPCSKYRQAKIVLMAYNLILEIFDLENF